LTRWPRPSSQAAAVKAANLAAVQLSGGPLEPADRTEILAAGLRILKTRPVKGICPNGRG
jgi:carbamoylphosphate synthase small subunit